MLALLLESCSEDLNKLKDLWQVVFSKAGFNNIFSPTCSSEPWNWEGLCDCPWQIKYGERAAACFLAGSQVVWFCLALAVWNTLSWWPRSLCEETVDPCSTEQVERPHGGESDEEGSICFSSQLSVFPQPRHQKSNNWGFGGFQPPNSHYCCERSCVITGWLSPDNY